MAVGHALEDVSDIGERFDVIELCGGDERGVNGLSRTGLSPLGDLGIFVAQYPQYPCARR